MWYLKIIMSVLPGITLEINISNRDSACLPFLVIFKKFFGFSGFFFVVVVALHCYSWQPFCFFPEGWSKKVSVLEASQGTHTVCHPSEWALSLPSTAQPLAKRPGQSKVLHKSEWTMNKPFHSPGKRKMRFFRTGVYSSRMPWAAGRGNLQWTKSTQPTMAVTQEQHVHQADLDQGQDSLTVSDPALISLLRLCQIFPGTEESLPIRNLEGTRFSLWQLHHVSLPIW